MYSVLYSGVGYNKLNDFFFLRVHTFEKFFYKEDDLSMQFFTSFLFSLYSFHFILVICHSKIMNTIKQNNF